MFQEYRWIPGKSNRVVIQCLLLFFCFILTVVVCQLWLVSHETINHKLNRGKIYPVFAFITIVGAFSAISTYIGARRFRMISTDEGLEITRNTDNLNLKYTDITRVETLPGGEMMVYSTASPTIPVIVVSNEISNREQLGNILRQYTDFVPVTKIPLAINYFVRCFGTFWFMLSVTLNVMTRDFTTLLITGTMFLAFSVYTIVLSWIFRKQFVSPVILVCMILLSVIVIFRMISVFVHHN